MTDIDAWVLYRGLRDEVIGLVSGLQPNEVEAPVALTPGWSSAQVLAHVCGLNVEVVAGAREGLGTDEATTRQVSTRSHMTVDEICEEWLAHGDELASVFAELPVLGLRLSADLVVHLHDLQHNFGLPIDRDSLGSTSGGNIYASRIVDSFIEQPGIALSIELTDGHSYSPTNADESIPTLTLKTTPYDALRSITGRRSRREVESLDWSRPPGELLDVFCPYGPLRTEDAGV